MSRSTVDLPTEAPVYLPTSCSGRGGQAVSPGALPKVLYALPLPPQLRGCAGPWSC